MSTPITRIHHLDCAPMRPALALGGRLTPTRMVAHVLLVERPDGLTLVDSGFGTEDLARKRMGRGFVTAMRPSLDPAATAVAQVHDLGYDAHDVTDLVLTHLDLDHAGGLGDFPRARVHVSSDEHAAAMQPRTLMEKNRYLAGQWSHDPDWQLHRPVGDRWRGFDAVQVIGDDVLMIPLHGHTRGHCAVAVARPSGGWFVHAGDAYFNAGEKQAPPTCPPGLAGFQSLVQVDRQARLSNQERLRSLHADHGVPSGGDVTMFCAHDAEEYDAVAGRTD